VDAARAAYERLREAATYMNDINTALKAKPTLQQVRCCRPPPLSLLCCAAPRHVCKMRWGAECMLLAAKQNTK
jgi:hypothetical protein